MFSLSLGLSLSLSLSFIHTHMHTVNCSLLSHILSLSRTRSLILSEILVAKAIRRVSRDSILCCEGMQDTFSMARYPYISLSLSASHYISTTYSTSIYIYIFIYILYMYIK